MRLLLWLFYCCQQPKRLATCVALMQRKSQQAGQGAPAAAGVACEEPQPAAMLTSCRLQKHQAAGRLIKELHQCCCFSCTASLHSRHVAVACRNSPPLKGSTTGCSSSTASSAASAAALFALLRLHSRHVLWLDAVAALPGGCSNSPEDSAWHGADPSQTLG